MSGYCESTCILHVRSDLISTHLVISNVFQSEMFIIRAVADIFDGNLVAGAFLTLEVVAHHEQLW